MGIYRSKKDTTVQVEAIVYNSTRTSVDNIKTMVGAIDGVSVNSSGGQLYIQTRSGQIFVNKGYYVVKDAVSNIFTSSSRSFLSVYESGGAIAPTDDDTSPSGYMDASIYDPTGVVDDAFDMDNMVDGTFKKTVNNYTNAEKNKLVGIAAGAEVNVNADWSSEAGDSRILNKPTTITADQTNKLAGIEEQADKYTGWNFDVDGVVKDLITTQDHLDFVSGSGMAVTRSAEDKLTFAVSGVPLIDGTPVLNRIAIWQSPTALGSDTKVTWDGTTLEITGTVNATSITVSGSAVPTVSNNTNNRVLTATGVASINGEANLTFDGSTLGVTGTVTWTDGGSANANTAYSHSQNNSQAHTDYLVNTGNDSTAGSLTATAFLVGTDEVFHEGDEDWQTDATTTPTMAIATSRNMELTPASDATTLAFSNGHDGMTGVVIIDASIDGTLTLPATSHPTTIPYASSYRVVASFVQYGSEYVWQYSSFPNPPV